MVYSILLSMFMNSIYIRVHINETLLTTPSTGRLKRYSMFCETNTPYDPKESINSMKISIETAEHTNMNCSALLVRFY